MLNTLRNLTESLPAASTLLDSARTWSFSYPSASGANKSRIAHKGTFERAFDKMRADLAQSSLASGGVTEIYVRALP